MYVVRWDKDLEEIAKGLRAFATGGSPAAKRRLGAKLVARQERVLRLAQRLCPVSEHGSHGNDPGFLRDSGEVREPKYTGKTTVQVDVAFPVFYAVYVHEDLHAHHRVGQAKFLEIPFLAEKRGALEDLEQEFFDVLREAVSGKMISGVAKRSNR